MPRRYNKSIGNFSKMPTEVLLDAIDTVLTEKQRQYCLDYFGLLLPMATIAEQNNVSVSAVSKTISRAKRRLATVLKYYRTK